MTLAPCWRGSSLALLLSSCIACRTQPPDPPHVATTEKHHHQYPGSLRPISLLDFDFQWRQRVTARWPGGQRQFDAVLAKEGDTLKLVGLGPMGRVGFVLRYRDGGEIEFDNRTQLSVPFDPKNILLDISRVYYPWFSQSATSDGTRHRTKNSEMIEETWKNGQLAQRRFRRIDDTPPGEIRIDYEYESPSHQVPIRAVLRNGWLGYTLEIETLNRQRLSITRIRRPLAFSELGFVGARHRTPATFSAVKRQIKP